MRVMGIDPGYERLGVAVVERDKNSDILLYSDCLKTSPRLELSERIFTLGQGVGELIKKWKPDALAIEKLFFTTNQKTAMGVSETRGAIIYIARHEDLKIFEYTPLQIKIAITGYGKADKTQIISMISKLIKIPNHNKAKLDDEYDAIAVGITCLACYRDKYPQQWKKALAKKYSSDKNNYR
ncbi:MAG: crossover junction endodeoxyribonuclease RuvC [Candidatus Vogelbacteria bacterium]|nr:crossover junction endodeoxyribonuclease RuvC [Candidatus Vogelbacteria bacterium]